MKLILYTGNGLPHHKNYEAIQQMCKSCSIEIEIVNDISRIKQNNYDILLTCSQYINPEEIPENIKIIMGPQFFVFPEGPIMGELNPFFSERCVYNILSPWIKYLYVEFTDSFIIPMKELPFSIDTNKFKPMMIEKEYDCIVYIKRRSSDLVNYTLSILEEKRLKYKIIIYGSYNEEDYLGSLQKAKFMITLDAHESQGFALEEAMSTNIPLLVIDATTMYEEKPDGVNSVYGYLKPKKLLSTSVPYWSDECGIKITEQSELLEAIDRMIKNYQTFTPRDYIMRTLSAEVCMKRILDYFKL